MGSCLCSWWDSGVQEGWQQELAHLQHGSCSWLGRCFLPDEDQPSLILGHLYSTGYVLFMVTIHDSVHCWHMKPRPAPYLSIYATLDSCPYPLSMLLCLLPHEARPCLVLGLLVTTGCQSFMHVQEACGLQCLITKLVAFETADAWHIPDLQSVALEDTCRAYVFQSPGAFCWQHLSFYNSLSRRVTQMPLIHLPIVTKCLT